MLVKKLWYKNYLIIVSEVIKNVFSLKRLECFYTYNLKKCLTVIKCHIRSFEQIILTKI